MNITINNNDGLFHVSEGKSHSCLGFHVVFEQALELVKRITAAGFEVAPPQSAEIGTIRQYEQYTGLLKQYRSLNDTKTWFDARVPEQVQRTLEAARKTNQCLRLFVGDSATGRCWLEELEVIGRIGRSAGPQRIPLLLDGEGCYGGAILTDCLVRILDADTGAELYRHKSFHMPELSIVDAAEFDKIDGYTHAVQARDVDGTYNTQVNFKSYAKAAAWVAFMHGETMKLF